jgi:hypothetical protein
MKSPAHEIANYCAKKAWARFTDDRKQWQQTIMDLDGDNHYCLCYSYNKSVVVHGIFNPKTGNYSVITVKL